MNRKCLSKKTKIEKKRKTTGDKFSGLPRTVAHVMHFKTFFQLCYKISEHSAYSFSTVKTKISLVFVFSLKKDFFVKQRKFLINIKKTHVENIVKSYSLRKFVLCPFIFLL